LLVLAIAFLTTIDDLVVDVCDITWCRSAHQMLEHRWDYLLAEIAHLVTVHTVPVHYSDHPQAWDLATEILQQAVTVLVDFAHLWDKSGSRVHSQFLDYLWLLLWLRLLSCRLNLAANLVALGSTSAVQTVKRANLLFFAVLDTRGGPLAAYIDASEVILPIVHVAICQRVYLHKGAPHRWRATMR